MPEERLYVPQAEVLNLVQSVHNKAHMKAKTIYKLLRKYFYTHSSSSLKKGEKAKVPSTGNSYLRKVTIAVVGRYLREAADLKGAKGGGGNGAKILQRLWDRLGSEGSPSHSRSGAVWDER